MKALTAEMRREDRRQAEGEVRVRFENPVSVELSGRLVDVSASGFRMSHDCVSLAAGELVEFSHPESAGRARVIWNRVFGERVETGFLIL
jgi:hypothetical protein